MKSLRRTILVTLLVFFSTANAQEFSTDHLQLMEDEELLSLFNEVGQDSIKQEKIARVYLKRAQKENDTIKMARGYDRLARIFHPEKNIQFADSVIALTKDIDNITYPALGYMLKANQYYINGNVVKSTEEYFIAYDFALRRENIQQQVIILDILIFGKGNWGSKKDALVLQKKRHSMINDLDYIKEIEKATRTGAKIDIKQLLINDKISSYENFVFCYLNLKKADSAFIYLDSAIIEVNKYDWIGKDVHKSWLAQASSELNFQKGEYELSYDQANKLLDDNMVFGNNSRMNLYLLKGLSLLELNKYLEGITSLKKADSIYENSRIALNPFNRILFEKLLEYSRNQKDSKLIKHYQDKLRQVDSIFKENYIFFEPNFIRNFETPKLLGEKEELISSLELQNKKSKKLTWVFLLLSGISLGGLFYYFKRQLIFKRRFEQIMASKRDFVVKKDALEQSRKNELSSELIKNILNQLDQFEDSAGFLSTEISLNELSKSFGTNARYLSKIINLEKEKNFSQYINDLRVEYAFHKLEENRLFRKYTIKAVANECGFNRAESFSKAFYKKFKIYPSFYLKTLEKEEGKMN
ncbi:AraC-like DNA-binding protein [Ulvibacter sp. MAR_2010_11]|uniref:helix-turn-helix domain-containing protein n=1 Tax=Ulvibacter sp. MAR_2010_11 TaxID=1250229 RepID=UPI000C2CACA3|nr:helix-turn-helix domain-containing protein [Ulvibacter sp. MAR_2010_11]PKA84095.1 AraC-like DNA-binding protein [Ulvibacter sp. MAR_2010_11]